MRPRSIAAAAVLALAALAPLAAAPAFAQNQSGVNRAYMDTTCSPCKDFFRYANGKWYDTAEIPATYTGIGAGREIADRNQEVLYKVLERSKANAAKEKDPSLKKLGNLYAVLMDSARADQEGVQALKPELDFIDGLKTSKDLQRAFERYNVFGGGFFAGGPAAPFRLSPEPDPKNTSLVIAQLTQGGLGLPERDYYFRDDPKSVEQRAAYVDAMKKMFVLAGSSDAQAATDADAVMKFETTLAESSMRRVDMRDPHKLYNKITVKELGALAPNIDWPTFFTNVGLPKQAADDAAVDVSMPSFMRQLNAQITATPMEVWRPYLKWTMLRRNAGWIGKDAFAVAFALQQKFTGQKEPQPRWKRATQAVDNAMGEALGKAYVATEFPPSSKQRMIELVDNLRAAFGERIDSRTWMSPETKKMAHVKLDAIIKKIGYPDSWRDYSALAIDPKKPAVANLIAASQFEGRRQLAMIGKAPDKSEWGMTPPTVNAYYNPLFNEIVFPAGILQPPQFDPKVDDAANYGGIGMVIGHEMTHGFDDQGRQYDKDGNLKDWWTDEDGKKFVVLANKVVDQYNGYVGVDTLHINGKLTLGENLADLGGLTMAYHAYQRSLKGKPAPVIDGWTGDQRFFLGFAQAWRRKIREDSVRQQVLTDPHSPAEWRVNGPVSNMDEFRKTFGCKTGDALVREGDQQIVIW